MPGNGRATAPCGGVPIYRKSFKSLASSTLVSTAVRMGSNARPVATKACRSSSRGQLSQIARPCGGASQANAALGKRSIHSMPPARGRIRPRRDTILAAWLSTFISRGWSTALSVAANLRRLLQSPRGRSVLSAAHAVTTTPGRSKSLLRRMSRGRLALPAKGAFRMMAVPRNRARLRQGPPLKLRSSLGDRPPPLLPLGVVGTAAGHLRPRWRAERTRPLGALLNLRLKAIRLIQAAGEVPPRRFSVD